MIVEGLAKVPSAGYDATEEINCALFDILDSVHGFIADEAGGRSVPVAVDSHAYQLVLQVHDEFYDRDRGEQVVQLLDWGYNRVQIEIVLLDVHLPARFDVDRGDRIGGARLAHRDHEAFDGESCLDIGGLERIIVVSDDGDRKAGRLAGFLLLDPAQLQIAN